MAIKYGINFAKLVAGPLAAAPVASIYQGRVRVVGDKYTTVAGDLNGDVIKMGKLFAGDTVLDFLASWGVHGAGVTLKFGDDLVDDRYMAAASVAAAGQSNTIAAATGHLYKITTDRDFIATFGGANPAAGQEVRAHLLVVGP
jgi:hypothetical protein